MTLWRIRATVDDRPGYLSVLTASLALRGVNILTVQVHTTEAGAVDDFLVDAPPALTEADLLAAVERGRGRNCWVARSEARGLVDQPTRALALAARLVQDPDSLGETLRGLLGADQVTWRPAPRQQRPGRRAETMHLTDPAGGSYEVARSAPSFTPAEYARAQALVDLAAAVARRSAERVTLLLADGTELLLRPAVEADLPAVLAMHLRCSASSRHRRYRTGSQPPSPDRLRRLLDPTRRLTVLAVAADGYGGDSLGGAVLGGDPGGGADHRGDGRVVAMASLATEGMLGELGVLVEDAWQRRGLGAALLRRLFAYGDQAGYAALVAHVPADNAGMLRLLDRLRRPASADRDGAMVTVTMPLSDPAGTTGAAAAPTAAPTAPVQIPAVHET